MDKAFVCSLKKRLGEAVCNHFVSSNLTELKLTVLGLLDDPFELDIDVTSASRVVLI